MSSKPFERKDLKHDQFVIGAGRVGHWLMERRRRIGWVVLAVAVVLSVVFSVRFAHQRQEQQAAALLAAAMEIYRAPVVPPASESVAMPVADPGEGAIDPVAATDPTTATDPEGAEGTATEEGTATSAEGASAAGEAGATEGTTADEASIAATPEPSPASPAAPDSVEPPAPAGLQYETLAAKNDAAIERLQPIVERYGSRPSGRLAAYYLGICEAELGNTDAAIEALIRAVEADAPLISAMATFRLGQLELGAGNAEAALQYFDGLLEDDGMFPQEEVLMAKARAHEDGGDPRAALAAYQRVMNEYSGTYAAVAARTRAEELSAELGVELQEPGVPSG